VGVAIPEWGAQTSAAPADATFMRLRHRVLLVCGVLAFLGVAATPANASDLIADRNATLISLGVNAKGEALITYKRENGSIRRVLAWGAVNANTPDASVPQTRFKIDYSGGWRKYRQTGYWKTFKNICGAYAGPQLAHFVQGCSAPDGTHWALQSWQRLQPLLGFDPWLPRHTASELHLSHWSGDLPVLEVWRHWTYHGQWQGLFGRFSYGGVPVYGFATTRVGSPTDGYGRNVYIDTFNSVYGPGWKRESGILVHRPTGTFCHSFVAQMPFPGYPSQEKRPPAPGERYRVTVMGPGVTPVVQWEGSGLTAADRQQQSSTRSVFDQVMAGDAKCAGERSA
jgi:hypothetical protein